MLVTILLCVPTGIASALYLEEFAPKNRITDLIEVNVNNLAAVPSIVFGLLGLAVFLNAFDLPRSSPLVGGLCDPDTVTVVDVDDTIVEVHGYAKQTSHGEFGQAAVVRAACRGQAVASS